MKARPTWKELEAECGDCGHAARKHHEMGGCEKEIEVWADGQWYPTTCRCKLTRAEAISVGA